MTRICLVIVVLLTFYKDTLALETPTSVFSEFAEHGIDNSRPGVTSIYSTSEIAIVGFADRLELIQRKDPKSSETLYLNRDLPGLTAYNAVVATSLTGHNNRDSPRIVSVHANGAVRRWKFGDRSPEKAMASIRLKLVEDMREPDVPDLKFIDRTWIDVTNCKIQDDGEYVICSRRDGAIEVWSVPRERVVAHIGDDGKPTSVVGVKTRDGGFKEAALRIIGWNNEDRLRGDDVSTVMMSRSRTSPWRFPIGIVRGIAILTNGRETLAFSVENSKVIWRCDGRGLCCANAAGLACITGRTDRELLLVDVSNGLIARRVEVDTDIKEWVICTDDASLIAYAQGYHDIKVVRTEDGKIYGLLNLNATNELRISAMDFVRGSASFVVHMPGRKLAWYSIK